jgi:methyl-accepting chemotaxis protein
MKKIKVKKTKMNLRFNLKSIRSKLIILMLALSLFIIFILSSFTYYKSVRIIEDNFERDTIQSIAQIEQTLTNFLDTYERSLNYVSGNTNIQGFYYDRNLVTDARREFNRYMEYYPSVINIYAATKNGEILMHNLRNVPSDYNPLQEDWYQQAVQSKGLVWTNPYYNPINELMVITAATPLYDRANMNEFVGVVAIDINLAYLIEMITNIQVGETGYVFIADENGDVILHNKTEMIGHPVPVPELKESLITNHNGLLEYTYESENKIGVFSTLDHLNWKLIAAIDKVEIRNQTQEILVFTLIISIIALFLSVIISLVFSKPIAKGIEHLRKVMIELKGGNFKVEAEIKTKDELSQLASDVNQMINNVSELIKNTKEVVGYVLTTSEDLAASSEQTSASAEQVSATLEQITIGASEQASDSEKGAQFVDGLSRKVDSLSQNSEYMSEQTKEVLLWSQKGEEVIVDLREKNQLNDAATKKIESAILALDHKANEISTILGAIKSIAEQTNLLALNASIEAARAGEHGRGFAVVAEEIRKLAEDSQSSAEEINQIILDMQHESQNTVQVMKEVKDITGIQSTAVDNVNTTFNQVNKSIESITQLIQEMSSFLNEIVKDKNFIVEVIESISSVSEETAASTEEINASMQQQTSAIEEVARQAERLNELAEQVNKEIDKFKI